MKTLFTRYNIKTILIFFLTLSININSKAFQNNLSTPKSAVAYLKKHTSEKNKNLNKASLLISSNHVSSEQKRKLYTQQIRKILNAIDYKWNLDSIPNINNYVQPNGLEIYTIALDIALEKNGTQWLISKKTIDNISDMLKSLGLQAINPDAIERNSKATKKTIQGNPKKELFATRLNLSSPQTLITGLSKYLSKENWRPDIAQQVIFYKHLPHQQERINLIVKFSRFINGKGIILDANRVPNLPNYIDTLHLNAHEYLITSRFAELYIEKIGDRWYLSKETIEKIPLLFAKAYPFGSDKLLNYLPKSQTTYLGLMVWQYIAILILIIVSFLFNKSLAWAAHYFITKILFKFGRKKLATTYIKPVVRPLSLQIAFAIVAMFLPILQLPPNVSYYLSLAFSALIPFFGTIAVYNMVDIITLYFEKLAQKTVSTLDDQLVPLFQKIAKTFVVIIGSIYVLANLNVQLVPLLATLSIGGLAFALAAQDTIKNFFGSLMIFVDRPFQVGQWITAPGIDGTVEEVGIRSTRIRTFSNSLIYVPNGRLADATINNHGLRSYRRFSTQLAITYNTPPKTLEIFIKGLRKIVLEHPNTLKEKFHIYMNDMNSHSLDIMFYIFFAVPTWGKELKCRHEIIISILKLAQKLEINFAFPTQTLHIQDFPGKPSISPKYSNPEIINDKMQDFFKKEKP